MKDLLRCTPLRLNKALSCPLAGPLSCRITLTLSSSERESHTRRRRSGATLSACLPAWFGAAEARSSSIIPLLRDRISDRPVNKVIATERFVLFIVLLSLSCFTSTSELVARSPKISGRRTLGNGRAIPLDSMNPFLPLKLDDADLGLSDRSGQASRST